MPTGTRKKLRLQIVPAIMIFLKVGLWVYPHDSTDCTVLRVQPFDLVEGSESDPCLVSVAPFVLRENILNGCLVSKGTPCFVRADP